MIFRRALALLALSLVLMTGGCCRDRWCCRHPIFPRCRPACCPEPSCCPSSCAPCTAVGYPPPGESFPPPPAPVMPPAPAMPPLH
jgi:hypothetical protein